MKIAIIAALLLATSSVHAADNSVVSVPDQIHESIAGESLDAFALRITPHALAASNALNAEVCGEFSITETGYKIQLYTMNHPFQCGYQKIKGGKYTGLSYHTHPNDSHASFSDADYDHPGYLGTVRKVMFQNGFGTMRRVKI